MCTGCSCNSLRRPQKCFLSPWQSDSACAGARRFKPGLIVSASASRHSWVVHACTGHRSPTGRRTRTAFAHAHRHISPHTDSPAQCRGPTPAAAPAPAVTPLPAEAPALTPAHRYLHQHVQRACARACSLCLSPLHARLVPCCSLNAQLRPLRMHATLLRSATLVASAAAATIALVRLTLSSASAMCWLGVVHKTGILCAAAWRLQIGQWSLGGIAKAGGVGGGCKSDWLAFWRGGRAAGR